MKKVDSLTWVELTAMTEVIDSIPKNVDFQRILFTFICLFLIWLTVLLLFSDVVDSRFTVQVDSFLIVYFNNDICNW